MSERRTLLSRGSQAPVTQPSQSGSPRGAFGDFSGLVDLGQGLSQGGNVGLNQATQMAHQTRQREEEERARLKALEKEQERRGIADAQSELTNVLGRTALDMQREFEAEIPTASPEKIVELAESKYTAGKERVYAYLTEMREKNVWAGALNNDEIETAWLNRMDGVLLTAQRVQGAKNVEIREGLHAESIGIEANLAGTDPDAAFSAIKNAMAKARAKKGQYSSDYIAFRMMPIARRHMESTLTAIVMKEAGVSLRTDQVMNEAIKEGLLTQEAQARLKTIGQQKASVNAANRTKVIDSFVDSLATAQQSKKPDEIANEISSHYTADEHKKSPAVIEKSIREALSASAVGQVVGAQNQGVLRFPFNPEKGLSLSGALEILTGEDRGKTLDLLAELSGTPRDYAERFLPDEIQSFRQRAVEALQYQKTEIEQNRGYRLAAKSPPVTSAKSRLEALSAVKQWYISNNVPEQHHVIAIGPDMDQLHDFFEKGDKDNFERFSQELILDYGENGFDHLPRALAQDPKTRPYVGAVLLAAQASRINDETVQRSALTTQRRMVEAAFEFRSKEKLDAYEAADPGVFSSTLKLVDMVSYSAGGLSMMQSPAGAIAQRFAESDLTLKNVLVGLADQGPELVGAFRQSLAQAAVYGAMSQNGSRDVASEMQRVANSVIGVMLPVRAGGADAADPTYFIASADMQRQSRFASWILGNQANRAISIEENKQFLEQGVDAFFLDGVQDVTYGGALGPLAKLDNFLGTSAITKQMGFHATGYKNRSAGLFYPATTQDKGRIPEEHRIPFRDLVITDTRTGAQRPLSDTPGRFTKSFDDVAKDRAKEVVASSPGMDPHSQNHQTLSEHGFVRRLPNDDLQVLIRPVAGTYELISGGVKTDPVPVYRKVRDENGNVKMKDDKPVLEPLIIRKAALLQYINNALSLRSIAGDEVGTLQKGESVRKPYPLR